MAQATRKSHAARRYKHSDTPQKPNVAAVTLSHGRACSRWRPITAQRSDWCNDLRRVSRMGACATPRSITWSHSTFFGTAQHLASLHSTRKVHSVFCYNYQSARQQEWNIRLLPWRCVSFHSCWEVNMQIWQLERWEDFYGFVRDNTLGPFCYLLSGHNKIERRYVDPCEFMQTGATHKL